MIAAIGHVPDVEAVACEEVDAASTMRCGHGTGEQMSDNDESVVLVAAVTPKAGHDDEVTALFLETVGKVHDEPGCLKYALHRDVRGSGLVMIEHWASMEALGAHGQAPALTELTAALDGKLDGPLDIRVFTALPAGDPAKGVI